MKIQSLSIKNIGLIADTKIEINKPLLVFYGEVKMGKSTLLNAVRWVCGGSWPADIIKHGEKEASIELGFDGGCVTRSWYWSKATEGKPSEIKARPVQFVRAGKPVANPSAELRRLMNPFLLDQDFLRNKSELERKQYFSELFAVDTTALDTEFFNVQRKASDLRAKLTGYGDLDLTPVEWINTDNLKAKIQEVRTAHRDKVQEAQKHKAEKLNEWNRQTSAITEENAKAAELDKDRSHAAMDIQGLRGTIQEDERAIDDLKKHIVFKQGEIKEKEAWLSEHPAQPQAPWHNQPQTTELDLVITSQPDAANLESSLELAVAQNARVDQYKKNLERAHAKEADEASLKVAEDRQRAIKKEKIAALSKVSETCGVPGLTFAEDGTFAYEGTSAGMLSTSQIMQLSSALSALYPDDLSLGVELLDRGESLGRSIFDYVKHAEAKKISVLATVVGQRPANVPENVGCFIVKDGIVFKDEEAK